MLYIYPQLQSVVWNMELAKFKERMVSQFCVQNLSDTAGADCRWSDLLKIAITPTVWGTDFHVYMISVVMNIIPILILRHLYVNRTEYPVITLIPQI